MRSLGNKARVRVTGGALNDLTMTLSEVRKGFQGTVVGCTQEVVVQMGSMSG